MSAVAAQPTQGRCSACWVPRVLLAWPSRRCPVEAAAGLGGLADTRTALLLQQDAVDAAASALRILVLLLLMVVAVVRMAAAAVATSSEPPL